MIRGARSYNIDLKVNASKIEKIVFVVPLWLWQRLVIGSHWKVNFSEGQLLSSRHSKGRKSDKNKGFYSVLLSSVKYLLAFLVSPCNENTLLSIFLCY